jgi:hypothetical protein
MAILLGITGLMDYSLKDYSEILRNLATVGGSIVAVSWFWASRAYKKHSEIQLSFRAFPVTPAGNHRLAEVTVSIENKGARRHKLARLTICVERLTKIDPLDGDAAAQPHWKPVGKPVPLELDPEGRFLVLQGVSQEFTHAVVLPPDVSLVRVTATFNAVPPDLLDIPYPSKRTARRIFDARREAAESSGSS